MFIAAAMAELCALANPWAITAKTKIAGKVERFADSASALEWNKDGPSSTKDRSLSMPFNIREVVVDRDWSESKPPSAD